LEQEWAGKDARAKMMIESMVRDFPEESKVVLEEFA
jgi:hypothetical protein